MTVPFFHPQSAYSVPLHACDSCRRCVFERINNVCGYRVWLCGAKCLC